MNPIYQAFPHLHKAKDMAIIETEKLTKYYGKIRGIESLDLCVEQGEIFGFLRSNGAGKTCSLASIIIFRRRDLNS
jgi:ABC-2 type transport system ATP-binding protein